MSYPETTDANLKENVQAAIEDTSNARSNVDSLNGREYSSGDLFTDVAIDATVGVLFELPSDAECFAFVNTRFTTGGKTLVRKVDSVTKDTAGTVQNINNRLIGANGDACGNVESSPTVSGGDSWTPKIIGGSGGIGSNITLAAGSANGAAVIVQPGENIYFEATNLSADQEDITIDVDWTEIPLTEVTEL
jgi:hypothetical protein